MKLKHPLLLTVLWAILAGLCPASGQVVSFTYQGQLKAAGSPANGNYDFAFALFNTNGFTVQVGATITNLNVAVTNGLFTTVLTNLAASNFNVTNLVLSIGVRAAGASNSFTPLNPFQSLTPVPYAVVAGTLTGTVAAGQVIGSIPLAQLPANLVTNNATNVILGGTFSGNGAGLTNLAQSPAQTTVTPILNMIWINPGTFVLGSPSTEPGRNANEGPQTIVIFTNGFWMGHHPVTQGEYAAVMTNSNPSSNTGNLALPVETVSWINATNYCATLTAREQAAGRLTAGWTYRLPTEAEREYSCRALTTTEFYWGNDYSSTSISNYSWYAGDCTSTQPVGQKLANAWGLVDMSGNVLEWCQDWFGAYPGGSVTNPVATATTTTRVCRGGTFNYVATYCRSAQRESAAPSSGYNNVGFRVVLAPN